MSICILILIKSYKLKVYTKGDNNGKDHSYNYAR